MKLSSLTNCTDLRRRPGGANSRTLTAVEGRVLLCGWGSEGETLLQSFEGFLNPETASEIHDTASKCGAVEVKARCTRLAGRREYTALLCFRWSLRECANHGLTRENSTE